MVGRDRRSTELVFDVEEGGICRVRLVVDLGLNVFHGVEYLHTGVDGWVDNVKKRHSEGIACQTIRGVSG
jgi:hypothetical protein